MAITKIAPTRNAEAVVRYLTEGESHDGIHPRIGSFSIRNMSLSGAGREIRGIMRLYGKEKNIQAYVIVQSFAEEELDPDSQEDLDKANEAGMRLARKYGGDDRQMLVVTQADNGKVHNHILIASTDTITGKALRGANTRHPLLKEYSDEILKEMGIRNLNEEKTRAKDRQTMGEIKRREKRLYVWKDDLKERIKKSLKEETVVDETTFIQDMARQDVDVRINGKGNVSYRFMDEDGKDRKCRASRLGEAFGKEGLKEAFEKNQEKVSRNKDRKEQELRAWMRSAFEESQKKQEKEANDKHFEDLREWMRAVGKNGARPVQPTPKPASITRSKPKQEPAQQVPTLKRTVIPKKKEEIPPVIEKPKEIPQNKELEERQQARRIAQELEELRRQREVEAAAEKRKRKQEALDARTKRMQRNAADLDRQLRERDSEEYQR